MTPPRLPDWEKRLAAFLADNRDRPFEWGAWDCALFGAAAVATITGTDHGEAFRDYGYSDAAGARLALKEVGAGTLLRTYDRFLKRKPTPFAGRGDIVMVGQSIGVCIGASGAFVGEERLAGLTAEPMRAGLVTIPRRHFKKAWAV